MAVRGADRLVLRVAPPPRGTMPAWLLRVGLANLLLTIVLAVAAVALAAIPANPGGLVAPVLMVATMLPLLAMRTAPGLAPIAVAVLVLITQLTVGPLITCGVVFPLLCVLAFQLGLRPARPGQQAAAVAGLLGAVLVESWLDPVLGVEGGVFIGGVAFGFFCGGAVLRSRAKMVARLRRQTDELARRRDQTAELAVVADRARIATDLDVAVRSPIRAITTAAANARRHLADGSEELARAALLEVERNGRETLASMRTVVGDLRDAPVDPPPDLDDLPQLLSHATTADARLRIEGTPRRLGPNLELTAYRIVEQLLATLDAQPRSRVEVVLHYNAEALRLRVGGPLEPPHSRDDEHRAAVSAMLTAVTTRAEVAGGRVETHASAGHRSVQVELPAPLRAAPVEVR